MDAVASPHFSTLSPPESSAVRKGRFLWMDPEPREQYLDDLLRRIKAGYFSTEIIVEELVEEIAPVIDDAIDRELSAAS